MIDSIDASMDTLSRLVLESLDDRIAILDEQGEIIAVNRAWREYGLAHGLRAEQGACGGNYLSVCQRAAQENSLGAEQIGIGIRDVLDGNQGRFELLYPCHDGQELRWFLLRVTALAEGSGRGRAVVAHTDVTASHRVELDRVAHDQENIRVAEHLLKAREAAEQASQAKSAFISHLSHELRTPLNAIIGFAQLMELAPGEDVAASVQEIVRAGRHLQALLDEALDLTRIEAGRLELHTEAVSVFGVLLDCFSLIEPDATAHGVTLVPPRRDCEALWVLADRRRLSQVLLNLISNGIKYNHEGGRVEVHCRRHADGRGEIIVSDTGVGIDEDRQSELFGVFNRLGQEGGHIEGTGLGLAISKHLAELMGGGIQVQSRPGEGSTFRVLLPLATAPEAPAAVDSSSTPAKKDPILQRHKVMYVEDNAANLRLVEALLSRREDIEFLGTQDPGACLDLARQFQPALIMLDINLPGISGHELLASLRQDAVFDATPIIAVSANAMPFEVEHGLEAGFSRYLTKPLDIGLFMETLDELLEDASRA